MSTIQALFQCVLCLDLRVSSLRTIQALFQCVLCLDLRVSSLSTIQALFQCVLCLDLRVSSLTSSFPSVYVASHVCALCLGSLTSTACEHHVSSLCSICFCIWPQFAVPTHQPPLSGLVRLQRQVHHSVLQSILLGECITFLASGKCSLRLFRIT